VYVFFREALTAVLCVFAGIFSTRCTGLYKNVAKL
jgi:hypothetical protein